MNKEQRERFETLIGFLDTLEPEKFYFCAVVGDHDAAGCGTVCCAIGWTPQLFPDMAEWGQTTDGDVVVWSKPGMASDYDEVASEIFGLPVETCSHLFAPRCQKGVASALPECGLDATPKEVAAMLRKFLELLDSGKIALEGATK